MYCRTLLVVSLIASTLSASTDVKAPVVNKEVKDVVPKDTPKPKDVPKDIPKDAPKDVHSSIVKRYASGYLKEIVDEIPEKYVLVQGAYQRDLKPKIYNPYITLKGDDVSRKIPKPISTYVLERTVPIVNKGEQVQKYVIVPQRQLDTAEYEKKIALVDDAKYYEDNVARKIKIPINSYTVERTVPLINNKEYPQKYVIVPQRQLDTAEYEKKIALVDSAKYYEDDVNSKIPVNTYTVERAVPLINNKEYSQKYVVVPQQLDEPELEKKIELVDNSNYYRDDVSHKIQTPVNTYTVERAVPIIQNKENSQKYLVLPQKQLDETELEKKVTLVEEKNVD